MNKGLKRMIAGGLIVVTLVGGAAFGMAGLERIPAGMVGIVYKANGGISNEMLTQGWQWALPIVNKVSLYSTSIEQSYMCEAKKGDSEDDESFTLMTADGKEVKVDMEFSYRFDKDKLPDTFTYFKGKDGKTIQETFIKLKMVTVANNVSTQFNVFDIYGSGRPDLNSAITKEAKEFFADYGIIVDRASITNVTPDEKTKAAIQQKVDKLQEVEVAKSDVVIAEENAKKTLVDAQAKADAKIIAAEADKKANELKQQSLTDGILKQQYIEKWDGKLPQVSGSDAIVNMK